MVPVAAVFKGTQWGEGLLWLAVPGYCPSYLGMSRKQGLAGTGPIASRKQGTVSAGTQRAFFFVFSSGFQSRGMVMPTVKVGIPPQLAQLTPPKLSQKSIS